MKAVPCAGRFWLATIAGKKEFACRLLLLEGREKEIWSFGLRSALSSAVEHFLHTEGVAGSNPAARTIQNALLTF